MRSPGPTDVGRGIIRLSRSDANLIDAGFNDLVEIESQAGTKAYAKCFFVHPDDETSNAGKVQIDSLTLSSLGMGLQTNTIFATVEVSKARSHGLANAVTLEAVADESGLPPDLQKIDTRWISTMLEDKPLWKGGLVAVPAEGKMSLFRIVSVDPPVAVGTMLTKLVLAGKDQEQGQVTSSKLFGFSLIIRFKKQIPDYDTLSAALIKNGFAKPESRGRSVVMAVPKGMDPDMMRIPQLIASDNQPPPPFRRGRIQVQGIRPETPSIYLQIGHCYDENPFEKPDDLLRDIELGFPLIQEAFEKDLNINFQNNAESIGLDIFYRVATGNDSRSVLSSITNLPDVPELAQLIGRKEGDRRILLYPGGMMQDRSLVPKGLIEITIQSMNAPNMRSDYDVRFKYGLVDFPSAVRLINSSAAKTALIVNALEKAL